MSKQREGVFENPSDIAREILQGLRVFEIPTMPEETIILTSDYPPVVFVQNLDALLDHPEQMSIMQLTWTFSEMKLDHLT